MKVAIFVEGETELQFVLKLVRSLYGNKGISLEIRSQTRGTLVLESTEIVPNAAAYILIVCCNNDEQVKTQIRDNYNDLVGAGYSTIIGLRDIYPNKHNELPMFKRGLPVGLPNGAVPIKLHLAVLETEAWFLDELTHFSRIEPSLTVQRIVDAGFDIATKTGEQWEDPAQTLHQIYQLAKRSYRKKRGHIGRTIRALSEEELYINVRARAPHFDDLLTSLESALFPVQA